MPKGVKGFAPTLPKEARLKAHELFLAGMSDDEIGRNCGVNPGSVRSWATRFKWKAERDAIAKRVMTKTLQRVESIANAEALKHTKYIGELTNRQLDRLDKTPIMKAADLVPLATALKTLVGVARENLGMSSVENQNSNFQFNVNAMNEPELASEVIDVTPSLDKK